MKRSILIFGAISGLIIAVMMIASTSLCYSNPDIHESIGMVLGYAGMIAAFSMIFAGVKNYRDKYSNGTISFGQAFKLGSAVMLIASTVYVGVWLVEYYLFMPDFMDKYAAHALEQAKASGISDKEYADKLAEMDKYKEWYKNPLLVILMTYAEVLPVGLLVTLLSALILKRGKSRNVATTT